MTRRAVLLDSLLVAVVLGLGQLEVWAGPGSTHWQGAHWAQASAYALGALALLGRRAKPLWAFAVLVAVYVAEFAAVGSPEGFGIAVPPMIGAYSVARWERDRPTWWGLVLLLPLGVAWIAFDPMTVTPAGMARQTVWWSPWVIAWLAGALVRSRVLAAEQRQLRRQDLAARAVTEERNRIARELHDVIGHSVSIMTVQASAVRRRLGPDQAVEREALEVVEATGREALAEMRRMVGVLRHSGETADREPAPGLGQLPRLIEQVRGAGMQVEVTVTGREQPLAPGLDLTAYRLVQEALTNAMRHAASPTGAEVSIGYGADTLELAVRDDGGRVPPGAEPGHGLLGLRERVSVYGGELVARPRPEGGFELLATLPLVPA